MPLRRFQPAILVRISISILMAMSASWANAGTITFSGTITQSTQDGTGPAVNNPSLNAVLDGDDFSVTLTFPGDISGPGVYNPLPGATLAFTDGPASETSFSATYLSVTADPDPTLYDVSALGCLSTGSGCGFGNDLAVNFSVAAASFNATNVPADIIAGLFPQFDLLEDDGATEIQASVTLFSNPSSGGATTPEPATTILLTPALGIMLWRRRFSTLRRPS